MDSTYNPHEGGSFGYGSVQLLSSDSAQETINDTFSYIGCEITLTSHIHYFGQIDTTAIYKFNLGDIDPKSLSSSDTDSQYFGSSFCGLAAPQFTCDTEQTEFETVSDKPLIDEDFHEVFTKLTGKDHESGGKSKTFVASFYFNDLGYAGRFKIAFLHAIDLCGGRPSPF